MMFRRRRATREGAQDRFERVKALYRSGRLEEAIHGFGAILEVEPNTPVVLYYRGLAFLRTGDLDRAIEDLRGVVAYGSDPQMVVDAHYNLGLALERQDRLEEAVEAYAAAIEMNPGMEVAYCNRGGLLNRLGRYEEALADLDRAVELDPADALARWNRALVHESLDQDDDVARGLEAYLELAEPGDPRRVLAQRVVNEVRSGSAPPRLAEQERAEIQALVQQIIDANNGGSFQRALELADAALSIDPTRDAVWDERAFALASLGRAEEALETTEQGLGMCPGSVRLRHTHASFLDRLGRRREALAEYRRYVETAPPEYSKMVETVQRRILEIERELHSGAG